VDCVEKLMLMRTPVHIISTNWSSLFIKHVLDLNKIPTQSIKIFANDLEFDTNQISTGVIIQQCISAQHKLEYLQNNLISPALYIGDSESDLLAIKKADIGILLNPSSICKNLCQHYELNLEEVAKLKEEKYNPDTIYLAESWTSIKNVLFDVT